MANAPLIIDGGDPIEYLNLTAESVIGKSMVLYGPSRTGKSVIIANVLNLLKDKVGFITVVCPTELSSPTPTYKNLIPRQCLFFEMKDKPIPGKKEKAGESTIRFFRRIIEWQTTKSAMYRKSMDIRNVEGLFNKTPRSAAKDEVYAKIAYARRQRELSISIINSSADSAGAKSSKISGNIALHNQAYLIMLRDHNRRNFAYLSSLDAAGKLEEDEHHALVCMDINPHMVLVLDDCAADLKIIAKDPEFRKLFYQGRHMSITLLISCQDDTDLLINLRKNAFYTICTSGAMATTILERGTFKFNKNEITFIRKAIEKVYAIAPIATYKLVYIREINKFLYFQAKFPIPKFRIGPTILWAICDAVQTHNTTDKTNPYYKLY